MTATLPMAPEPPLTKKDFETDQDVRWCPGCGDYAILSAVQKAMPALGLRRENIVFISGIGCSSRFPYYMNTFGFHTIHGRAPAFVSGLKIANPALKVFMVTGDGDGLSIGGNHLLHILRRNVDVTILLINNRIYGLTKGQYSPASEIGKITKSSPYGSVDRPVDPIAFALGAGATFVARSVDRSIAHLEATVLKAAAHKGTSIIEIYQNCNIFNDGAYSFMTEKATKADHELVVESGKPLVFGPPENRRALKLVEGTPTIVPYDKAADPASYWVYDATNPFHASVIPHLQHPDFPVPIGVFKNVQAPTYVELMLDQEKTAIEKRAPDLASLIAGKETWEVK